MVPCDSDREALRIVRLQDAIVASPAANLIIHVSLPAKGAWTVGAPARRNRSQPQFLVVQSRCTTSACGRLACSLESTLNDEYYLNIFMMLYSISINYIRKNPPAQQEAARRPA